MLPGLSERYWLWAGLLLSAEGVTSLHYRGYSIGTMPLLTVGVRYQLGRRQ